MSKKRTQDKQAIKVNNTYNQECDTPKAESPISSPLNSNILLNIMNSTTSNKHNKELELLSNQQLFSIQQNAQNKQNLLDQETKISNTLKYFKSQEPDILNSPQVDCQHKYNFDLEKQEINDIQQDINQENGDFNNKEVRRINTTAALLEDEYFGEDTQSKQEKRNKFINPDLFSKIRDHHVDWDTRVFFEIFWYHLLFYLFVGPLTNIIYWKRRILMKNLAFWGVSIPFFLQFFIYFCNVIIIVLYFTQQSTNIYLVEIIFTFLILVLRCYVISCKYATLHPDKIKLYRDYVLDMRLTLTDYYLQNWIKQDCQTIYRETYNALQRGEFDSSMFYIQFFVEPTKQTQEIMFKLNGKIGKFHKYTSTVYQPECIFQKNNSTQFYGYSVLGFIIQQFIQINGIGKQILYAIFVAGARTALPICYRYYFREKFEFTYVECIQLSALSINNFLGYFFSFVFLFFYIRDMRMKDYILNQCKLMLQVKKLNLSEKKILPTIDIINPYSLKAWSILRRVCLDYGKQYVLRLQAYLSIYFFSIFFTSALLVLWILKVYQLDSIYPIICLFELAITFTVLLYIIFWGCLINECFTAYKNTLGDHKVLFLDLQRMKNIYFFKKNIQATNFVLKKSVEKITNELDLKNNYNEQLITERLNQLMNSISDCENELEQDFNNQPFTIYGIRVTITLFQKIIAGILTLVAGFIQIYLFMNKNISFDK